MKLRILYLATTVGLFFSCNGKSDRIKLSDSLLNHKTENKIDTMALIIPGKSIGKIYLGEEATNLNTLGKPDGGDAAMGKAWGIWYVPDSKIQDYAIYTSYRDTSMKIKEVKQIRTENSKYKLANGLKVGSSLSELENAYTDLLLVSSYVNSKKDTLKIYEVKNIGASFDLMRDTLKAISVQYSGTSVSETYLTIYPGWKKL